MKEFKKEASSSNLSASPKLAACFWAILTVILTVMAATQDGVTFFVYVALCLLWLELCSTGYKWCFIGENWPSFISAAWLLACTLGVWLPFQSVTPSSAKFVFIFLAGYSALRLGMLSSVVMQPLRLPIAQICRVVSPEHIAPRTHKYGIYAVSICSGIVICCIYLWFRSIPILSSNPEFARYQHFNGPFTNNLFRFSFRVFSSLSLVTSLYIIAMFNVRIKKLELFVAIFSVVLASLCMIASGNRGDISVLFLFLMIRIFFCLSKRKKVIGGMLIGAITLSVFCLFTWYRNIDRIISFVTIFPEIPDGVLLLQAAHTYDVPFAYGKTYLAAALSFIPSSIFPFRETWGFGRYALEILYLGQNTPIAPTYGGLRPTFVGEAYLNGGYFGVVAFGMVLGIILGIWRCSSQSIKILSGTQVVFFLLSLCSVMVSDFYGVFHGIALTIMIIWLIENASRLRQ